ncbi:hypothetical protein B0T14DRAFT_342266 [Immersiella caudata]|uniref:Uncharacterized protein n=1 Tax=Immersiella caudata TaxID=314043 RepID=A0AA39U5H1_9PEZI|nr:hypothetical protein B0T14DRAFT_342266 [Immersiella caudata]
MWSNADEILHPLRAFFGFLIFQSHLFVGASPTGRIVSHCRISKWNGDKCVYTTLLETNPCRSPKNLSPRFSNFFHFSSLRPSSSPAAQ